MTTTMATAMDQATAKAGDVEVSKDDELLDATLFRLTQGLPRSELQLIVSEAVKCEELLEREIRLLEEAMKLEQGDGKEPHLTDKDSDALKGMTDFPLTPLDNFWTVSALVGRLRGEMTLPRHPALASEPPPLLTPQPTPINKIDDDPSHLLDLLSHPNYTKIHDNPQALLAIHKKLMGHRSSNVFKRAVKEEEAPGYHDRIAFPLDLSLVRKQIVAKQIQSYKDLHERIALIAFNCIKFNGRESDYGLVAKEFEQAGDDIIRQAVLQLSRKSTTTPVAVASEGGGGGGSGGAAASSTNVDNDPPAAEDRGETPTTSNAASTSTAKVATTDADAAPAPTTTDDTPAHPITEDPATSQDDTAERKDKAAVETTG